MSDKKIRIHKKLCDLMHELYITKNADYGDSFAKVRKEVPNAITVRLLDKIHRIINLLGKDSALVSNEAIEDTLIDLANYCLLELVERLDNEESVMMNIPTITLDEGVTVKTEIISAEAHNPEFKTELKSHGNWVDECTDTRGLE
jgi:hypothetical protein